MRLRHESSVVTAAFSPDGKVLATGSGGNFRSSVRLWDVATGRQLHRLTGFWYWVERVAFSPDGKLLAGSAQGAVTFWGVATGERVGRIRAHTNRVSCFAFSPDGKLLATADKPYDGDENKTYLVRLWDVAEFVEVRRFAGHPATVRDLAFSPDGRRLASCSPGEGKLTVLVWDLGTGKLHRQFQVGGTDAVFSPDGRALAVRQGGTVRLWDVTAQKAGAEVLLTDKEGPFFFTPDGKALTTLEGPSVRLWDAGTGKPLRGIEIVWSMSLGRFRYSPDGKS